MMFSCKTHFSGHTSIVKKLYLPKNVDIKIKSSALAAEASPGSQTPMETWQVVIVILLRPWKVSGLPRS